MSSIKTIRDLTLDRIKTFNGISIENIKTFNGILLFDSDATVFINACATAGHALTWAEKLIANKLITDLKQKGLWTKVIGLYPEMGGSALSIAINAKSPGTYNLSFSGTITYSATGMAGNGVNGWFDTTINDNTVLSQNDFSLFTYIRTNQALSNTGDMIVGNSSTNGTIINSRNITDNFATRAHCTNVNSVANTDSKGFYGISRSAAAGYKKYKNKTETSVTEASTGKVNDTVQGMRLNGSSYNTREHAFDWVGYAIDTTEESDLYDIVQAFETSLGRNV